MYICMYVYRNASFQVKYGNLASYPQGSWFYIIWSMYINSVLDFNLFRNDE